MERWRKSFHEKSKLYQQDVFSWCIQGMLKLLDVILVLKSHNACTSKLRTQVVEQVAPSKIF